MSLSEEERWDLVLAAHMPPKGRDQIGVLVVEAGGPGGWGFCRSVYCFDDVHGLARWYVDGCFPLWGARSEKLMHVERAHVQEVRAAAAGGDFEAVAAVIRRSAHRTAICWVGRFSELFSGDHEECVDLRREFWATDTDDYENPSWSTEPIPDDKFEEFADWVWRIDFG